MAQQHLSVHTHARITRAHSGMTTTPAPVEPLPQRTPGATFRKPAATVGAPAPVPPRR